MASLIRITDPDEIRPLHVVVLALLLLALGGNCLLTSGGKSDILPDGAREWRADSVLLALVEVLDLNYAYPTPRGVEIKALVQGLAAAVGLLVLGIGWAVARTKGQEEDEQDTVIDLQELAAEKAGAAKPVKRHIDPILAAQGLMLALVVWSLASTLWSHAPDFAWGGSVLLAMQVIWAVVLGYGLHRRAAHVGGYILMAVLVATAGMAILYFNERNPTIRASYPIGNPLFLAACLIPGLLLAAATVGGGVGDAAGRRTRGWVKIVLGLAALAVLAWAFHLARARGPLLGLGVGAAAALFFAGGRRVKVVAVVLGLAGLAAASTYFYRQRDASSPTGRSASLRVRFYSWDYALDLIRERPVLGHGQGGYALLADALAADDVENDPEPLDARMTHAHNEWLEMASDLGSVGLVLVVGAVGLTLQGGARALGRITSRSQRATLIALLAGLAAIAAEECTNVGLRVEGLPLVYYTAMGLIWAMARPELPGVVQAAGQRRGAQLVGLAVCVALCFGLAELARRDFRAARALYDLPAAIAKGDWGPVRGLARQAVDERLSPQRKLTALEEQTAAYIRVSEALKDRYLERRTAAGQTAAPDATATALVTAARRECEADVESGLQCLSRLRSVTASDTSLGLFVLQYQRILSGLAMADAESAAASGDLARAEALTGAAAQHRRAAAAALGEQLRRWPFAGDLAIEYVLAAAEEIPFPEVLVVLSRPLRLEIPTSRYAELAGSLWQDPRFREAVEPQISAALAQAQLPDARPGPDRWAPEKLRLAAIGESSLGRYEAAAERLRGAIVLYKSISERASLATSSSYAELGQVLFLGHPEEPGWAIKAAEKALHYMPQSQAGRIVRDAVRDRLVQYHLAAGHEDFARDTIRREIAPGADQATMDALVGHQYALMSYATLPQAFERAPDRLRVWSERAAALDPAGDLPRMLAADLAIRRGDRADAVRCIERCLRAGDDLESVAALLDRGLRALPDCPELQEWSGHLQDHFEAAE